MQHAELFIILAAIFGFFMAWGIGANDVANAMGLPVGSKALTITQALIVAAIFEVSGALLAGGQVTNTIRGGIVDIQLFANSPQLLIYGMLAALLSAGSWLLIASYFGWPVSTTHSIVGAIIGFAIPELGVDAIKWSEVINIALSWVVTPLIGGVIAYLLFISVQWLIFNSKNPFVAAKRYVPGYIFLAGMVVSMVTLTRGVKHLGLHLNIGESLLIAISFSGLISLVGIVAIARLRTDPQADSQFHFARVEKIFGILMVFTACAMAFAHGSNDVANAIGPLAAVIAVSHNGIVIGQHATLPYWVLILGAIGIVTGLGMFGYRVIATIGSNITQMTPSRGFAAGLATAATVVLASGAGMPVSTTQTLVGAVLGVGIARGIGALNLSVIRDILLSWVITLPAGALFAIIYFHLLAWILPK